MYAFLLLFIGFAAAASHAQLLRVTFNDVTVDAGVSMEHQYLSDPFDVFLQVGGGAAGSDIDGDGWPDLFVVGGDGSRQHLFVNRGDGTFVERAEHAGVAFGGELLCGPSFADIDGDYDLDLFIGVIPKGTTPPPVLLKNDGSGNFVETARAVGMFPRGAYFSASFGDFDGDGDLDLMATHWGTPVFLVQIDHLWRNDGQGNFVGATAEAELQVATLDTGLIGPFDWSFTANFVDVDGDGHSDILLASDFGISQVFRNTGDGRFVDVLEPMLTDENGMGAAVGDFDNDGDLDWFVTSIFDPTRPQADGWGISGNRLYRNDGGMRFTDVTTDAGVRDGSWGWGACAADFDNDGWIDIFHVNGFGSNFTDEWLGQPARLYMNDGDGSFSDRAVEAGIDDRGEGRGIVCFDYDRDGDIDVFIGNITGPVRLYQNQLDGAANFLQVKLVGSPPNTEGIGALVTIAVGGNSQIREIRAGSNFVSQDPAVAHFGVGTSTVVDEVRVRWPQGDVTVIRDMPANRHLVLFEVDADANCDGTASASDLVALARMVGLGASTAPCPGADVNYDGDVNHADVEFAVTELFVP